MSQGRRPGRHAAPALPRRQHGVVLMIALIVLVALTLAGLSMLRTSDTGSVIAGNVTLRQAAVHAAEPGLEGALAALSVGGTAIAVNLATANTRQANRYYEVMQAADTSTGLPSGVDWSAAPTVTGAPAGYTVRYVIERMCVQVPATLDEVEAKCLADKMQQVQAVGVDAPRYPDRFKVNYRISVRVTGPRNTQSVVQTVFLY